MFSQSLEMLGLIHVLMCFFFTADRQLVFYFTVVRSKLEYALQDLNNITTTGANKLECIQRTFGALCFSCFIPYNYAGALDLLKVT
jgi:hypothetical protein